MPSESIHSVLITLTMVLLCRMKVWKPSQRSFMHSSNATMTKASSSRVAWTCKGIKHTTALMSSAQKHVPVCVCLPTYIDIQT